MSSPGIKINEIDLSCNDYYKKNYNNNSININISISLDDLTQCCTTTNKMQYIDDSYIDNDYYE